jgi:hypothetical protein
VFVAGTEGGAGSLVALGLVAIAINGEWAPGLVEHFRDRRVAILLNADPQARQSGDELARALDPVTESLKLIDLFPGYIDGRGVAEFLKRDTAGVRLMSLIREADEWEPGAAATAGGDEPATTEEAAVRVRRDQGAALLNDVYKFLGRFIAYPSEHAHVAHALWVAHAHTMGAWESTPRIAFLSPEKGSGKTRAMEITELLVPNPVLAVNVTPAYLFRKIGDGDELPTILFDEIDTVFGPKAKENEEVRALINSSGHRQGAVAGRCAVRGANVTTEEIPSHCAVAVAGLGWLPDTILSRSVIIRMRRRAPDEYVEAYRRRERASGLGRRHRGGGR